MAPAASPASIPETIPDLPLAQAVAGMFRDAFDVDSVGLDDNFFRLGGDSLIGETLIMEIERVFGVDLSISALIDAATPRALAATIADKLATGKASSNLITPRTGSGIPLICIHGFDGESMFPERLASTLPGGNPIFGFRSMGLEAGERPITRIEDMARHYLKTLKETVQPTGPYLLLGHCGGTHVAYEMAQILMAGGEEVAGLIMIDPAVEHEAPFLYRSGLLWQIEHLKFALRNRRLQRKIDTEPEPDVGMRRYRVSRANRIAVPYYVPRPLNCPTLLVHIKTRRADLLNSRRGYQTLIKDISLTEVDLDHMALFTKGLPEVTQAIRAFLDRVAPGEPVQETA